MLGAGACEAEGVGLLEGVAADQFARDLASESHDGDGIHHGIHEAGHQVGGAGSGGSAADAHFTGGARVALRRETGVLFVAHQYVPDVVIVDRFIERESDASGISEEAVDAFPGQTFQQHFRAVHQTCHIFLKKSVSQIKKATSRLDAPR
jgi:hypothetical protein